MHTIQTKNRNTNGERQPSLTEQEVGQHASVRASASGLYSATGQQRDHANDADPKDTPRPPQEVPDQDDRPERHPPADMRPRRS